MALIEAAKNVCGRAVQNRERIEDSMSAYLACEKSASSAQAARCFPGGLAAFGATKISKYPPEESVLYPVHKMGREHSSECLNRGRAFPKASHAGYAWQSKDRWITVLGPYQHRHFV